jgi:hypothetical protein
VTARTADLLAALAESRYVSKQDQARFLAAIAQRLATANEIFSHGEQDRFASVAVAIVFRPDFDSERWALGLRSWTRETRLFLNRVRRQCRLSSDSKTIRISCVLRSHGSL